MILIALGSSLGFCGLTPQEILPRALGALGRIARLRAVSRYYRSPAWPDPADPPFVNAVAAVETGLAPEALLAALHAIEAGFGRRRGAPNAPRSLDLDLLDFNGVIRTATAVNSLVLPHPRLRDRDFVLLPLAEVASEWRHPASGETIESLIAGLENTLANPI